MAGTVLAVPNFSQEDFLSFHAAHFSTTSVDHFAEHFLGPVEDEYTDQTEDDGLGYYDDGVKRTLTNKQIAIFRHSEVQSLLRDQLHADEKMEHDDEGQITNYMSEVRDLEDGELEDDDQITLSTTSLSQNQNRNQEQRKLSKKSKKAQQRKRMSFFKQNMKPDLRKRTWDKVESGMGSLDYDGEEGSSASTLNRASQRRRISYDDD